MKQLQLVLLAFFAASTLSAQVTIEQEIDDMTDKVTYYVSHLFVVSNEAASKGFTIKPMLKKEDGKIFSDGWIVNAYNLGGCNEDNELVILFTDGTKITLKSFSKFRCETYSFFMLSLEQETMISTKAISKVRYTNGYTYDSYTNAPVNSNYFIQVYDALETANQ